IYFKTNHMPVRFLIYVAITALTRLMISDISHHHRPDVGVLYVSGAILLLVVSILVVRYASARFPSVPSYPPRRTLRQPPPQPRDSLGEECAPLSSDRLAFTACRTLLNRRRNACGVRTCSVKAPKSSSRPPRRCWPNRATASSG